MKVCILSEGSYPVIRGGLSEWAHMLIKSLADVRFDVFCIVPYDEPRVPVYEKLPNIDQIIIKPIVRANPGRPQIDLTQQTRNGIPNLFKQMTLGQSLPVEEIYDPDQKYPVNKDWLASREYWNTLVTIYNELYPQEGITDFFWTIFGFATILVDSFNFIGEIPDADIYHSLSTGFSGYAGALAKIVKHKPMITIEQGLYLVERRAELARNRELTTLYRDLGNKFAESLVKTTYKYADRIVPPCRFPHTKIETDLGADPSKITVIHNGIEVDRFTPGKRETREVPLIGCFARVVPIKGIIDLIRAAKIVTDRCQAEFVVLGEIQDKAYFEECSSLVKELGLSDSFRMVGHAKAEEWYRKVDIFTMASHSEGVPYALLEAMSSGLPSVCTGVGGIPEILTEGVGFVVEPRSPEALAEKLCHLIQNPETRHSMGQFAMHVAREKYTLAEMASNFRRLYEELVK